MGGTVNDVVLAAITQGFRELLEGRGDPSTGPCGRSSRSRSAAPASAASYDNRVSAIFAELPVEIADPVSRLARSRATWTT